MTDKKIHKTAYVRYVLESMTSKITDETMSIHKVFLSIGDLFLKVELFLSLILDNKTFI